MTSSAERLRRYRERQKVNGLPDSSQTHRIADRRDKRMEQRLFADCNPKPFCGCDGEGAGTDDKGRQLYLLFRMGLKFLQTLNWPKDSIRYLYPVDGPSIAQWREYRIAKAYQFPNYNPFALDQVCLYNWPVAVPEDPTAQIS